MRSIFAMLALMTLSACPAPNNPYKQPVKGTEGISTIESQMEGVKLGLTSGAVTIVYPVIIDNQSTGHSWSKIINIFPGNTTFEATIIYRDELLEITYKNYVTLDADIRPNSKYYFKGDLNNGKLRAWIEDSKGNNISGIKEANLAKPLYSVYIPIPVY